MAGEALKLPYQNVFEVCFARAGREESIRQRERTKQRMHSYRFCCRCRRQDRDQDNPHDFIGESGCLLTPHQPFAERANTTDHHREIDAKPQKAVLQSHRLTGVRDQRESHALTSSTAAHIKAVVPKDVDCICRSSSMRARSGKAVMLIDTPRNKAKGRLPTPLGAKRMRSGEATATAKRNGRRMLKALVSVAVVLCCRRCSYSS
jgi:hypothetical protein